MIRRPLTFCAAVAAILLGASAARAQFLAPERMPPTHTGSTTYRTTKKDTLWDLAERFYGNHLLWKRIAQANPSIKNPKHIPAGTVLTIPPAAAAPAKPAPTPAPVAAPSVKAPPPAPPVVATKAPSPAIPAKAPPLAIATKTPPPAAPKPAPKTMPAALPASPPAPSHARTHNPWVFHESMPAEDEYRGLNQTLPAGMTASDFSLPAHKAPLDWRPEGFVRDRGQVLAAVGDEVEIGWDAAMTLYPGGVVYIVQRLGSSYDPGTKRRNGVLIQNLARVRLTQIEGPRLARGVIESSGAGVEPGAAVQTQEP